MLYDTDYYLWTQQQAKVLQERKTEELDWENLKEEIEALGRTELNSVHSYLQQLIAHRIKLENFPNDDSRKHWLKECDNFINQIEDKLTNSMKNKIDLEKQYQRAKKNLSYDYDLNLPDTCPYTLEDLLNFL